jgi:hypothetical protein
MAALLQADSHDVIVRRRSADRFTIAVKGGAPQVACGSLGEALLRAAGFAVEQNVSLWYTSDGRTYTPLAEVARLRRIWSEYVEMPGLRLTPQQVQRLCATDAGTSACLLSTLVGLKFLERGPDGQYGRTFETTKPATRLRMAKAALGARHGARPLRRAR